MPQPAPDKVPVYILAGGQSSRFGQDKARVSWRGRPLIQHVARAAAPLADGIWAVGRVPGQYQDLGLPTIADRGPHAGPLSGLEAALDHCAGDWLLLLGCDFVGVQTSWLQALLQARRPQLMAVAFRGELWQPLVALYQRCLRAEVTSRLGREELALWRLLADQGALGLPLPADWERAIQANTLQDLERSPPVRADKTGR